MLKFRKRTLSAIVGVIVAMLCMICLVACSEKDDSVSCKFVTYDGNSITVSGKPGSPVTLPTVERDGFAFDGWFDNEQCDGEPVSSVAFKSGAVFYAKWTPVYKATLMLEGGELASGEEVYIRLGASIAEAMKDYEPTKADFKFGGWFVGDDPLTDEVMTESGITLTARYMAHYTVNVRLQNADLSTYTTKNAYAEGYALIGDEYTLSLTINGYEVIADEIDNLTMIIDGDKTKNVFNVGYDRRTFNLILNANYPDGTNERITERHVYGIEFDMPENTFAIDGSRFVGWALEADAAYADVLDETKYTLDRNTQFYAVWNVGYVDMFGGKDVIYVSTDDENKAILCRAGVDIAGAYNEKRRFYDFSSETTDLVLHARLNDNRTFLYYENRRGVYKLVDGNTLKDKITVTLDDYNGITYNNATEGELEVKRGTYSIDEDGYYVAEFEGGESFVFIIGTATMSDGKRETIYRVRGDEYAYGVLALKGIYYPTIELDGFGNGTYTGVTQSGEKQTMLVSYTLTGDKLTIRTSSESQTLRLYETNGTHYYERYNENYDIRAFGDGDLSQFILELDGGGHATYRNFNESVVYTGEYELANTIRGGFLARITEQGGKTHLYRIYPHAQMSKIILFEELHDGYAEYNYINTEGLLAGDPFLVDNGDGTGALYERNENKELFVASQGTFVKQAGDTYKYTVVGEIDPNAVNKVTELVVKMSTVSSMTGTYEVYYWMSSTGDSGTTDHFTAEYTSGGATLKLVSRFAVYDDGKGKVITGLYSTTSTYSYISYTDGDKAAYVYFIVDKDTDTFEVLSTTPVTLTQRKNNLTTSSITLTVTGRETDGRFEAIHVDGSDKANVVTRHGYYTSADISALGVNVSVCTFVADDNGKTFKFLITTNGRSFYFEPYETTEVVTLATYSAITDGDTEDDTKKVSLTDEMSGDLPIVLYTAGENASPVKGTVTSENKRAFGVYDTVVYTFSPIGGGVEVKFTLLQDRFRICGESAKYTAADGSTLELDGESHIARYTASNSEVFDNRYLVGTGYIDSDVVSISMYVDDVFVYFDLGPDNSFEQRGAEAKAYLMIKNGSPTGKMIKLDGHGKAEITDLENENVVQSATYTKDGDLYEVAVGTDTYVGALDILEISSTEALNVFVIEVKGIAGTYYNKADMTVLVLDDLGNVTFYGSTGRQSSGTYVRVTDDMFYYVNDAQTDGGMYTVSGSSVVKGDYYASFYAKDFRSMVFYRNGVVRINNGDGIYFTYDKTADKLYIYKLGTEGANAYGFVKSEIVIKTETVGGEEKQYIEYTVEHVTEGDGEPAVTTETVKYTYFDGKYITLIDDGGNKLEFQPTGTPTFTVDATYTFADETQKPLTSRLVVVDYDDNGEVNMFIAWNGKTPISGSKTAFQVLVNQELSMDLDAGSFVFDPDKYMYGLTAYDYSYMQIVATYGEALAQQLAGRQYGVMSIIGETTDEVDANGSAVVTYTLSGRFNFILGKNSETLTFTDGKISTAGYFNDNYGNLFTAEFTGSDGELYHVSFYIAPNNITGTYTYIIYAMSRVTKTVDLGGGSFYYEEEFLYTTGFNIIKGKDEDGNDIKYESGDKYVPTIKYKGEIVCASGVTQEKDENRYMFYSQKYSVSTYASYYYYVTYTVDADDNETVTGITRLLQTQYANKPEGEAKPDTAAGVLEDDNGNITHIFALVYKGGTTETVETCEKNEDGSFTVTTEKAVYTVTFATETEDDQTTTYVTIVKTGDVTPPETGGEPQG